MLKGFFFFFDYHCFFFITFKLHLVTYFSIDSCINLLLEGWERTYILGVYCCISLTVVKNFSTSEYTSRSSNLYLCKSSDSESQEYCPLVVGSKALGQKSSFDKVVLLWLKSFAERRSVIASFNLQESVTLISASSEMLLVIGICGVAKELVRSCCTSILSRHSSVSFSRSDSSSLGLILHPWFQLILDSVIFF